MITAVCTLFEKDYHHGVAALVNSLHRVGFRGRIYAGYRGELPHWAKQSRHCSLGRWPDVRVLPIAESCEIAFLPMSTTAHFTNFKPDFMLDLFADASLGIEQLFYLDPDICVVETWRFMADWISCGVALCEDVNSPLEQHHPRRDGWRHHFGAYDVSLQFPTTAYVNGGCVGVSRRDLRFLQNWQLLSQYMAQVIGGLQASTLEGGEAIQNQGFARCFDRSDQDTLNAAIGMAPDIKCSILAQAAMSFTHGAVALPHALGKRKPWRRHYLREAVLGSAPTTADKTFWDSVAGPIRSMSSMRIRRTRAALACASAAGRFYRRQ